MLAENLALPDDNCNPSSWHVFLRDRETAGTTMITCIPGLFSGSSVEGEAAVTPAGDVVAFRSSNGNLVENDTNGSVDIFVYSENGLERISLASDGSQGPGCSCSWPDTWDVFAYDSDSGETISLSSHLASGGQRPAISDDGTTASFTSSDDVYRVDLGETVTAKLVVTNMQYSALTTAGEAIVVSGYNSLVPEDVNGDKDVYLMAAGGGDGLPDDTEICDDGVDNDGDGRTDCRDRDCRADPICQTGGGGGRKTAR